MESKRLPKSLGLFRLTIYGVGTIIGSGIYAVVSPAASLAGENIWLSFILAAVISSFTAFSYAELASAMPSAGAEHSFIKKALPDKPIIAFLVGCFIAIHGTATVATVAITFSEYARQFINFNPTLIAISLVIILSITNIAGLKKATWINTLFTTVQISCLLVLVWAGFSDPSFGNNIERIISSPISWNGVFGATAILFFIYTGYEHMASLSEEAENPKDLWKAFLLALVITTVIYLAVIFAVLGLIEAETLAESSSPLLFAAEMRWQSLGTVIGIAALLATANGVLSGSISVSRLLFGISRDGDFPNAFSKTTKSSDSPWIASLTIMAFSCVLVFAGKLEFVASLSSLGALLVFTVVNGAVIVLRIKLPDLKRPFKIPFSLFGLPILPLLGMSLSVTLATAYSAKVYLIFLLGLAIGFAAYFLRGKKIR